MLASVCVDHALKKRKELTIPIQCANIFIATLLPALGFAVLIAALDPKKDPLEFSAYWKGWNAILMVFTMFILTKNWMSNIIIKVFSSTTTYIIFSADMLVTYAFEISLGYRSFKTLTAVCITAVSYGVYLYTKSKSTVANVPRPTRSPSPPPDPAR